MKKIIYLALILLAAAACDKNEDVPEQQPGGEFTFNGKNYPINSAAVETNMWQDSDGDIRTTYFFIFTDKFVENEQWEQPERFQIETFKGANITNLNIDKKYHNFDYARNDSLCAQGDGYGFAYMGLNLLNKQEQFETEVRFPNGSFCVQKTLNSSHISIEFNCSNNNNQTITGTYYGKIFEFETFDF